MLSGTKPLEPDADTTSVLKGVQASRPTELRGQPLNFGTTPVNRAQISTLVSGEGGDPAKFNSSLRELAGPNASVTSTPMLLRDGKGHVGAASLFTRIGIREGRPWQRSLWGLVIPLLPPG